MKNYFSRKYFYLYTYFIFIQIAAQSQTIPGFYVKDRFLYSPCGEKVILRGVNEMSTWCKSDKSGEKYFPEIAKTGANTVRITLDNSTTVGQMDTLITNCIANKMIPIAENHSATGRWANLESVFYWWMQPEIISIIKKHEKYLLLNIANEAGDWEIDKDQFIGFYTEAVSRFREAGINVPLLIDASGWGQDINILQATWKDLQNSDPLHNLIFSVHMWWSDNDSLRIANEIKESVEMEMPLLVGEFAHKVVECKCCINYKTIIKECNENEIGYLAWSWGAAPNGDCSEMDMTCDGTFETLGQGINCGRGDTSWALEVAVASEHSIKNTSIRPKWILNNFVCQ
jgi:mannan endo-1,4-beta-mannosidase